MEICDTKSNQVASGYVPTVWYRSPRILCAILTVATFLLYGATLRNGFINYDDPSYVTANPHVRQGLTGPNMVWALKATVEANWHPVTWVSHMCDAQLFGMHAAGHHFTNILLHVCNVIILFFLLQSATGYPLRSAVVAALFALHPLNVESVAWIAERKSVLSTTFLLLAIWAYSRYLRKPSIARYVTIALSFALGLMAKPAIVTFPLMLMLIDYWPLARDRSIPGSGQARFLSRSFLEKLPFFAMSAGSACITIYAQQLGGAVGSTVLLPFRLRINNAIFSYSAYLGKALWPSHLSVFYPHPENSLPVWQVIFSGLFLIAISLLIVRHREKRYLLAGWLWYLGTMFPMIGVVQVGRQAMADRYAYLPFIGLFVIAVWSAAEIVNSLRLSRRIVAMLCLALLFSYASVAFRQISYWRNSVTLFSHAIEVTGPNAIAEDNLGDALAAMGDPDLAFGHFKRAIEIAPDLSTAHYNLATLLQSSNQLSPAIDEYTMALAKSSDPVELAQAHNNLGVLLATLNRFAEALPHFNSALELDPAKQNSLVGRGWVQYKLGNLGAAKTDLIRSTEIGPSAVAYFWLGRTLQDQGDLNSAAGAYDAAVRLAPGMREAQNRLDAIRGKK